MGRSSIVQRERSWGIEYLKLQGCFEYPIWIYDIHQATQMPLWKACLWAAAYGGLAL